MSHPSAFSTDTHRGPADTCAACTAPVEPAVDDVAALPDVLDRLAEVAAELTALDEAIASARHAEDDPARRLELHAIGDSIIRAWGRAQLAASELREFLAVGR